MKAATAAEKSGSPQMEKSRAVAESPTQQNSKTDESKMGVEEEERNECRTLTAQKIRRRMTSKTLMEESRMDGEGKEKDETRKLDSNKGQTTDYDMKHRWRDKMMTKQLWQ